MTDHDTAPDDRSAVIDATTGRDAGKRYRVAEVDPYTMSGFVLRLLCALRMDSEDDLFGLMHPAADENDDAARFKTFMRTLSGADPDRLHALLTDALANVEVAADPQHPSAFRRLNPKTDIREMATLGDVVVAFFRTNVLPT